MVDPTDTAHIAIAGNDRAVLRSRMQQLGGSEVASMLDRALDAPVAIETEDSFAERGVDETHGFAARDAGWPRRKGRSILAELALNTEFPYNAGLSINETRWDGKPFPWLTTGPLKIELARRDVAKVTLVIPVRFVPWPGAAEVPEEPQPEDVKP